MRHYCATIAAQAARAAQAAQAVQVICLGILLWLATNRISEFLLGLYGKVAGPRPVMNSDCNGCRTCLRNCPPQALVMVDRRPVVDYDKCIRCFCCQELCPQQAVSIHHPRLGRVILKTREAC